jgi:lipoprotein-anchoring transpeptidase ErfK/SrfK
MALPRKMDTRYSTRYALGRGIHMKKWKQILLASVMTGVLFAGAAVPVGASAAGSGGTRTMYLSSSGSDRAETEVRSSSEGQTASEASDSKEGAASGASGKEKDSAVLDATENGAAASGAQSGTVSKEQGSGRIISSESNPYEGGRSIQLGSDAASKLAVQTIADGTYVLTSGLNAYKALQAENGEVTLRDADGSMAQRFTVSWNADGSYYTIRSASDSRNLSVYARRSDTNNKLVLTQDASTKFERWYIAPTGDGSYQIISAQSLKAAGLPFSRTGSGTNATLLERGKSAAQTFRFLKAADQAAPTEGIYQISPVNQPSVSVRVDSASMVSGANVMLQDTADTDDYRFQLRRDGGAYVITSIHSGMVLTSTGTGSGANVVQKENADSTLNKWYVRALGDRTYYILSKGADKALSRSGGNMELANVDGSSAQRFYLTRQSAPSLSGTFYLGSALNSGYVIAISGGSRKMQANVELRQRAEDNAQKFKVEDQGNGTVVIRNVKSKHVLDAECAGRAAGTNIWQYKASGSPSQAFFAHRNSDGSYSFINVNSSKVLELQNGNVTNGANIRLNTWSGSGAQKFTLTGTTGSDSAAIDYSIWEAPKPPAPVIKDSIDQKAQGYSSATQYEILVNRSNHTVSVYSGSKGSWTRIKRFACGDGKASTPTIEGVFSVGLKMSSFGHGYTCWYATQISGNYLFHSVLYYPGSKSRIKDGRLGMGVSHGCVRLAIENAKWIYDTIPRGTRIVIYH